MQIWHGDPVFCLSVNNQVNNLLNLLRSFLCNFDGIKKTQDLVNNSNSHFHSKL